MIWTYDSNGEILSTDVNGLHFEIDYDIRGDIDSDNYVVVVSQNGKAVEEHVGHGVFECLEWANDYLLNNKSN